MARKIHFASLLLANVKLIQGSAVHALGYMLDPRAPLTYFDDGGGGGVLKDFLGSDILAKRDFLGSMKDAGICLGRKNNTGIFLGIVFFISSNQQ